MTTLSSPVAPEDIQKELNRIWESLETTNVNRACLFNLIFYTQKNGRLPYIQRLAQKVVEKFPSRVIFITTDMSSEEDFLKTQVAIMSSSKGEFDVSCDYISIETSKSAQERIPFVILPHILPDLPVYLLWGEAFSNQDSLFSQIQQLTDRLIFDSETAEDLPFFASSLLEQWKKHQGDIADLNWARIESWREMFSRAFHAKEKLKQIQSSQRIKIFYNSQSTPFFCHTPIQAVYFQAWLACQLDWKWENLKKENSGLIFNYSHAEGTVEVSLFPTQFAHLPPGLILSVEMTTANEECFSFKRDEQLLHQVTFQYSTRDQCALPSHYVLSKAESGHSLVKEIGHRGTSEHFLKVLNFLKTIGNLC